MQCKGIVAVSKGEVSFVEVEVSPPGPGEVQVRMASTLISAGTERAFILGLPNATPASYPYIPGYCCAGIVESFGEGVQGFEPGDRVACFAVDVGHREIGNVPCERVAPIPDGVTFEQAAFTSLGQTSMQGVRKCRIEIGEPVATLGLGIVGLLAMQFSRVNGALPVIGIDRLDSRLRIAEQCGAEVVLNNQESEFDKRLKEATKGKGPAVVLESTGFPDAMSAACRMADDYARICILGCPRGTVDFNFYRDVQKKSISVIGAHAVDSVPLHHSYPYHWTFFDDAGCFLELVKKGRMDLAPLTGEVISWKDAEAMFRRLLTWDTDVMGIVINWPAHD